MNDLGSLFAQISSTRPPEAWPTLEKCQCLGALVVARRPKLVVEIGVWTGDSLIPQLLALRHVGTGRGIAIDPWAPSASIEGQDDVNVKWWGRVDHERSYQIFTGRLRQLELECGVIRAKSDEVSPAELGQIDMIHIDGNHGPQAVRDVDRFTAHVPLGGILVMDDLGWTGGSVRLAYDRAVALGFVELYPLGTGCVMQRRTFGG
jgi:predicted O-methyltransferase YrrM